MTSEPDAKTWRNRFILINLVRIGGTVLALLGLLVWQTDLLRDGGWTAVGFPLALIGVTISFGGPQWLAVRWRTPRDR